MRDWSGAPLSNLRGCGLPTGESVSILWLFISVSWAEFLGLYLLARGMDGILLIGLVCVGQKESEVERPLLGAADVRRNMCRN